MKLKRVPPTRGHVHALVSPSKRKPKKGTLTKSLIYFAVPVGYPMVNSTLRVYLRGRMGT